MIDKYALNFHWCLNYPSIESSAKMNEKYTLLENFSIWLSRFDIHNCSDVKSQSASILFIFDLNPYFLINLNLRTWSS